MSDDAIEVAVPQSEVPLVPGLSSPPDSNDALKLDASDSELSDIEEPEEDIGDVLPDHYADEGRVPVFKPAMAQFKNFQLYMKKINEYGMKSGIVKVIPPQEWRDNLPPLDEAIKTIKIKEPIKQEILGSGGTYRQMNILHQRSYNLPQWRQLCEQSEHQPPAKRGERRANQDKPPRPTPRPKGASTPNSGRSKKKGAGRSSKKAPVEPPTQEVAAAVEPTSDRLPTPVSPSVKPEEDLDSVRDDADDEDEPRVAGRMGRMGGVKQPKAVQSVSSRRKYSRREAAGKIDEEAFKNFQYQLQGEDYSQERCDELERAYWKTLTYASPLYGADMLGSLFDDRTKEWNLGKLENLLDVLGTKVPGVNTAYLYLGMWKATFAWHLEDVDLYSINYLHFGAPKQWYSISQKDARRFEGAMSSIWPTDAKACDQFLRHKTFLISPSTLLNTYNIKVNKVVHHPGEFVITFPYGYHSGYNLGYNCAEAVNFALPSWLEYGRIAKKCDCDQAQDSVWIDVHEIERKLRGEETDYDETEDEEEEEDGGPTDLPTPPQSSGDTRPKPQRRKRKRPATDKEGKDGVKRIRVRIRIPSKEPCALCPNDIPTEQLLPTDDGRKVHRMCARYIPETDIENGTTDTVTGLSLILKARLELKCNYCKSKKGACFQCSQKKCTRAYHPTCAAAAGVFVEEGEVPLFGEDGTEYKTDGIEFSCRFHRAKRDKKYEGDSLENDERLLEASRNAVVGETIQWQPYRGEIFAGVVVENHIGEEMLLVDILPKGERIEVDYKWRLLPDPADYHLPKPSANAIPMPKTKKLNTSKRHADDDIPRKEDVFAPGFVWELFQSYKPEHNPAEVRVDLTKDNQMWYYLGKNSTEAKAQYTEDPANPRHNTKGNFLDTIPKPVPTSSSSRHSYPASYPSGVNQHALNAARVTNRPYIHQAIKQEKPYEYKPRVHNDNYPSNHQAYSTPQNFQPQSTAPYLFGSDPKFGPRPVEDRSSSIHAYDRSPAGYSASTMGLMAPPPTSQVRPSSSGSIQAKPNNPFSRPPSSNGSSTIGRTASGSNGSSGRYYQRPNPFAKYPYLQKQHNRSPLDYKSPYSQSGGFMNGYEGDLKEHLRQNPEALWRRSTSISSSSPVTPNSSIDIGFGRQTYGPPPLPYSRPSHSPVTSQTYSSPATPTSYEHSGNQPYQQSLPPQQQITKPVLTTAWQKKDSSQLHPAIRQDYGTMFHHQYQPTVRADQLAQHPHNQTFSQTNQSYSGSPYQSLSVTASQCPQQVLNETTSQSQKDFAPVTRPEIPQQQMAMSYPQSSSSHGSYVVQHPSDPQLQPQTNAICSQPYSPPYPIQSQEKRPLYPHQQYFQNVPAEKSYQGPREVPDVPADSQSLIDHLMTNLRRASSGAQESS